MAKPKTPKPLRAAAIKYAKKTAFVSPKLASMFGYEAGHRAGARLTKAERKVIEAAKAWQFEPVSTDNDVCKDLSAAVMALEAKKVRK